MKALIHMAESGGLAPEVLRAVETRNQAQKLRLFEKIRDRFGAGLAGRVIALWGLAFKPGNDDLREAPALPLKNLMRTPAVFDGRNQYDPALTRAAGFEYFGMGR
jgi:UDPglucose 6-dehydrogenase